SLVAPVQTPARRATGLRSARDRRGGGARGGRGRTRLTVGARRARRARAGRRGALLRHRPEPGGAQRELDREQEQRGYEQPRGVLVPREHFAFLERALLDLVDLLNDAGECVLVGGAIVRAARG